MLWLLKKLCYYSWLGIIAACAVWIVSRFSWYYTLVASAVVAVALYQGRVMLQENAARLRSADVSGLSPLAYEEYCALLLSDAGWQTHTTPLQDQGVDVIAMLRGTKVAIQCKLYTHPVGNRAVQEVVAGRLHYGAHLAVVVSTATYTASACALAASTRVLLLHHDQLPQLEWLAKIPASRAAR
ncbi:MAG: restriction endonuclease [Xanthobacteraceae bacterium]